MYNSHEELHINYTSFMIVMYQLVFLGFGNKYCWQKEITGAWHLKELLFLQFLFIAKSVISIGI